MRRKVKKIYYSMFDRKYKRRNNQLRRKLYN